MVLERDGRRQRPQPVDLDEDLRAVGRVRLHHPALALVERARLLQDVERNPRLADVVEERRLGQRRGRRLIESNLLANQQAQRRDVDRMAVGQVLVQLHRENLAERGVARRDLLDQQVHDVADRRQVDPLPRHDVVERPLGQRQRQLVRRIESAGRRVGPLHGLPARVDRHQPAEADVLNLPRRELHVDRLAGRRFLELPQELRQREQLRAARRPGRSGCCRCRGRSARAGSATAPRCPAGTGRRRDGRSRG